MPHGFRTFGSRKRFHLGKAVVRYCASTARIQERMTRPALMAFQVCRRIRWGRGAVHVALWAEGKWIGWVCNGFMILRIKSAVPVYLVIPRVAPRELAAWGPTGGRGGRGSASSSSGSSSTSSLYGGGQILKFPVCFNCNNSVVSRARTFVSHCELEHGASRFTLEFLV